jgi:hypothetical protein
MPPRYLTLFAFAFALTCQWPLMAQQAGDITGVGGIFVTSKDPKALATWYREVLGLNVAALGWRRAAL